MTRDQLKSLRKGDRIRYVGAPDEQRRVTPNKVYEVAFGVVDVKEQDPLGVIIFGNYIGFTDDRGVVIPLANVENHLFEVEGA